MSSVPDDETSSLLNPRKKRENLKKSQQKAISLSVNNISFLLSNLI